MAGGQDRREPIGDIVDRLVEDGRATVRAEIGIVRAIIAWRVSGLKLGVPLLLGALFLAQGVLTALLVGLVLVLAPLVGAGWATLIVVAGALALVGLLGWLGVSRCRTLVASLPDDKLPEDKA